MRTQSPPQSRSASQLNYNRVTVCVIDKHFVPALHQSFGSFLLRNGPRNCHIVHQHPVAFHVRLQVPQPIRTDWEKVHEPRTISSQNRLFVTRQ